MTDESLSGACLFALLALVALATGALPAQSVPATRVDYRISCSACTLQFRPLGTLGHATDPVLVGGASGLVRDSRGRFFHSSGDRVQVVVFGPDLRYVTAIGRSGSGPGEFGSPGIFGITTIHVGPGDSLWVFHSRTKVSVFSPELTHVRTFFIPVVSARNTAILRSGEILVSERVSTPRGVGNPFHVLTRDGAVARSFGGDNAVVAPGRPAPSTGFVELSASGGGDSFWISRPPYRLQRWSIMGAMLQDIHISTPPWFVPPTAATVARSTNVAIHSDPRGFLWLLWYTPVQAGMSAGAQAQEKYIVEVLDPVSGQLLHSHERPTPLQFVEGTAIAYALADDLRLSLFHLDFSGSQSGQRH